MDFCKIFSKIFLRSKNSNFSWGFKGFKAVGRRGRGRDIRLECKVVVQVLGHGGIAKGLGVFGEDFGWMVLGGEEKGGGVVVDFVVGREVGEWGGGEEVFWGRRREFGVDHIKKKGGGGGGEGGPLSPRSYLHNKAGIIRDLVGLGGGGGRGGGGQPSQDSCKFPWLEWQRGWRGGRDQPPI